MNLTPEIIVSLLNGAAVSVFGAVLSASFCCPLRRRSGIILLFGIALMLIPQGAVYLIWSAEQRLRLYPLIMHVPTVILLLFLTRKPLWSVISVLCAYLFCEIRRWFGLLAVLILHGGTLTQNMTELIVTLPLLLFLLTFASPAIRQMTDYPIKTQCQFGLIPAIYYVFDYVTRIYTDLLSSGSPVVLEFMPFVCCVAYLVFLLYNSAEERKRQELLRIQSNLDLQLSQAVREITRLRDSQEQTIRYRHDLRHHLKYLSSCLDSGQEERARTYISEICGEIEAQTLIRYCENEAANLVLSSFAGRAEKKGAVLEVQGAVLADISVSDNDLCVLLSNSLENALNACEDIAENRKISVQFRYMEDTGKLFLQITNPCHKNIKFEKGVPVSSKPGHGIGVRSVCAIVERYDGCYDFEYLPEKGLFTLRLSL